MLSNLSQTMRTINALQDALDATLRNDWFGPRTGSYGSYPPINVFRKGDDMTLVAEVPGAKKEDFTIEVKRNVVRLAGKRIVQYDEGKSAHRLERHSREFDRTLTLPFQVDPESIKAEYRDGILALQLRPAAADRPRTVEIA